MIKEIAFTAYPARDVAKLREWYEKNLALKFSGPYVEKGVEQYNESDLGGTCFSLDDDRLVGSTAGRRGRRRLRSGRFGRSGCPAAR